MLVVSNSGENNNSNGSSPPTAALCTAPSAFYYGMQTTSDNGQLTGTTGSSSSIIDTPVIQVRLYMILQPYSQVIFIDKSTWRRFLMMPRTVSAFYCKITMVKDKKKTNQTETGGNLRCCPI